MPELYPDAVEGPYTVPSGTDIADGPQAFRDFADSLGGLSDTLEVFDLAGDHTVTAVEMGGLFTHSGSGMTLTVESGVHPVGSVMAVSNLSDEADSVVTVETPNLTETVGQYAIMSFTQVSVDVWVPNGGGAGGGGALWAVNIDSEADLAGLDEDVVAAREEDGTLWARCGANDWRMVCDSGGNAPPGKALITGHSGAAVTTDKVIDGVTYDIYEWTSAGVQHSVTVAEGGGLVDLLMIGGGGGGRGGNGGGGGAGGYLRKDNVYLPEGQHQVWVGRGGSGSPKNSGYAFSGEGSAIGGIYAAPGGGAGGGPTGVNGHNGGSGGGAGSGAQAGAGTQGFGHNGSSRSTSAGGGGGAGGAGSGGSGGPGLTDNINGTDVERAKGGRDNRSAPEDGSANTGTGGGGGTYGDNRGGNGGTGLIILRVQK